MEKTNRLARLLKRLPFFLLTIPFVFLINIANHYFHLLHWEYILLQTFINLALPVLLYWTLAKIWRSPGRSGVFVCVCLFIFYFFAQFYDWILSVRALSFLARYSVILPLILLLLIGLVIFLSRKKGHFPRFYYITNLLFIFLLIGGIIQYIILSVGNTMAKHDQADPNKTLSKTFQRCDTCSTPDIYFFIFDGYTNTKTYKSEFVYDNNFVENKLRNHGFFVAENSRSNYNFTHMSIASEFNLDYLKNLDNTKKFHTKDFFESYYTLLHNEWCEILKKQGYTINNYSHFGLNDAPVQITPNLTELTWRSVWGQTFFNKLNRDIGWHLAQFYPKDYISKQKAKKIQEDVDRLKEVSEGVLRSIKNPADRPQFTYAHFLVPHETYFYDSSGNRLPLLVTAKTNINKKDYVIQSAYTNKFLMLPLVDSIFRRSRRPFIIIIQSDHGYRSYPAEKVMLEFENFNSFYFPDQDYRSLSDTISSVNTFRIISNKYFQQKMPMLKDSMINLYKINSY